MPFADPATRATPAMAEINIIPLCDVLLVLLIIFMVTAPALSHQVDVDLPRPNPDARPPLAEPIDLRIDAGGTIYWNGSPTSVAALRQRMDAEARRDLAHQPTLEIDMSGDAEYGILAKVLAEARNAHLQKIGFVRK